jgi:hypothetical protein
MKALVDNDVLFKGVSYDLLDVFLTSVPGESDSVGVLGASQYVLESKIRKRTGDQSSQIILELLEAFLVDAEVVEPTDEEQSLAAEFELIAQSASVSFDSGESQLCAILIARSLPLLLTGDKRAIIALEKMLGAHPRIEEICLKIECLEQLVRDTLNIYTSDSIRSAICKQPDVDMALSICFSCSSASGNDQNIVDGLNSYIDDLRSNAPHILHA